MDESVFWLKIWRLIAACICVLAVTVGGCTASIALSKDPLASSCAAGLNTSSCIIVSGRKPA